jgi:Zn-dependent protease
VLYALDTPLSFLALLVGFGVAILARGLAQVAAARALGGRDFELRARTTLDPRQHGDVFGLVAAVLGGTGWGREAPVGGVLGRYAYGRARGRPAARAAIVLLAGPVAAAAVGVAAILGGRAAGASALIIHHMVPSDALHGDTLLTSAGERFLVLAGVAAFAVAVLELIPIPPLDGGRFLLAVAPTTVGWQRVRHYSDQNWGVGVLLLLLIIPLWAGSPVLLAVVDAVGEPLLRVLGR